MNKHHKRLLEQHRRQTPGYKADKSILPDAPAKPEPEEQADSAIAPTKLEMAEIANQAMESALEDLQADYDDAVAKGAALNEENQSLRTQMTELFERRDDLEGTVTSLEEKIVALKETVEELEEAKDEPLTPKDLLEAPQLVHHTGTDKSYIQIPVKSEEGTTYVFFAASEWKNALKRSDDLYLDEEIEHRESGMEKVNSDLNELYDAQNANDDEEDELDEDSDNE